MKYKINWQKRMRVTNGSRHYDVRATSGDGISEG